VSAAAVVVLIAAVVACVAAVVVLVAAWVLVGQVRRLERGIEALRHETVPLVQDARMAADHAVAEIARVDAVLADTEAVTATVDRASRAARRAFANPVVKVLAWRAGAIGGLRRLRQGDRLPPRPVPVALVREGQGRRVEVAGQGARANRDGIARAAGGRGR
jgi:hypothetical protein